jgi:hypothetical protein
MMMTLPRPVTDENLVLDHVGTQLRATCHPQCKNVDGTPACAPWTGFEGRHLGLGLSQCPCEETAGTEGGNLLP